MPPDGPKGSQRYRDEWQPVLGVLWDEFDRNVWREIVITGPAQASKSFGALVIPTLRDVLELQVSPIVGVPEADMFADKWQKDFKPVIEASPALRAQLPKRGSGARDGRVRDMVTFRNDQSIKVMSRGGQATNKAGFTSQRLRITEAAGFSEASQSSANEEADAYRQLVARLGAFDFLDERRFVAIEGTVTIAEHLPWKLRGDDESDDVLISSKSKILSPCPHCEAWISPEREHFVGWQDAKSALEAYEKARFACPACGELIDDEARRKSVADLRLVHHGQEITPAGEVVGDLPRVPRLFFRWSTWHNCLINIGSVAVAEWEAAQIDEGTIDRENAERDLCQKKWAIPFQSRLAENEPLNPHRVRRRHGEWQRGLLPADTQFVVIGIDIGQYKSWWVAIAFRDLGRLHIPAYGRFQVCLNPGDDITRDLPSALFEFDRTVVQAGFPQEGRDGLLLPEAVGVDFGFMPDTIAQAIRHCGTGWDGRWWGMRGRDPYHDPKRLTSSLRMMGTHWHAEWNYDRLMPEVTFDADYWLRYMQDRLRANVDRPGAMTFYHSMDPNEHGTLVNHLVAEKLKRTWHPERGGLVEKWVKEGQNHLGDACKMALVMGDLVPRRPKRSALDEPPEEANYTISRNRW